MVDRDRRSLTGGRWTPDVWPPLADLGPSGRELGVGSWWGTRVTRRLTSVRGKGGVLRRMSGPVCSYRGGSPGDDGYPFWAGPGLGWGQEGMGKTRGRDG